MPGFRYRLGDEVHDLTTRTLVMGILNRTPDSFYDQGLTFELDSLLQRAEVLVEPGRRPPRRRRREGRPGPRGRRGRGARPRRRADRRAGTSASTSPSPATPGGRRCSTRRARPVRWSATTSAGSAIPTTSRSRPATAPRSSPPTSGCSRGSPIPTRTTTTCVGDVTAFLLDRAERGRGGRARARADRARRRPRPRQDARRRARCCCARATPSPSHGYTLLLSSSNKRFLGELLELDIDARRAASLASVAYGVVARLSHRPGARRRRLGGGVPDGRGAGPARMSAHLSRQGQRSVAARPGRRRSRHRAARRRRSPRWRWRTSPSPAAPAPAPATTPRRPPAPTGVTPRSPRSSTRSAARRS